MSMEKHESTHLETPVLSTVHQFCEHHPVFTEGGLRYYIFNAETNGLQKSGAIVRLGRRVLINEDKFFNWVEAQTQHGGEK